MSAPWILHLRDAPPTETDETTVHISCCEAVGEIALCGRDISADEWDEDSSLPVCQVCAELDGVSCWPRCPVQALRNRHE